MQKAVNREQSVEDTLAIVAACREHGMRSVNIDLIYGLPKQTRAGFERTLDIVVQARPDRIAVYSYAHLPQLFKPQQRIALEDLPSAEDKLALLQCALERLGAAGYVYIGMDHFALPDDELARAQARGDLHRNFMGYTTHADSDLIGFGVSAISHIGDSFSQNPRDIASWERAIDDGRLRTRAAGPRQGARAAGAAPGLRHQPSPGRPRPRRLPLIVGVGSIRRYGRTGARRGRAWPAGSGRSTSRSRAAAGGPWPWPGNPPA